MMREKIKNIILESMNGGKFKTKLEHVKYPDMVNMLEYELIYESLSKRINIKLIEVPEMKETSKEGYIIRLELYTNDKRVVTSDINIFPDYEHEQLFLQNVENMFIKSVNELIDYNKED